MKRNVVLLIDADPATFTAALSATEIMGFEIRSGQIRHDLSEFSEYDLDDVAAIILDYDPDAHGSEIAAELPHWLPPRPLIFISSQSAFEYPHQHSGAPTKYLTKPVSAIQVVRALDTVLQHPAAANCDRWGHPMYEALVE
jgi:FixJ family two-component response regulator